MLVTGAAGFIGFHLSRVLAENKNNFIIGLDNFNDYYDVKLKIVSNLRSQTVIQHYVNLLAFKLVLKLLRL